MTRFSVYAQLTKADFVRLTILRTYKNFRGVLLLLAGGFAVVLAVLQAIHVFPNMGSPWPTLLFGVYFVVGYPGLIALMAAKNYNASTFLKHGITYEFDGDGVSLSGNKDLEMRLGWSQIIKKQGVGNYLLLFTGRANAFIIPKDQFTEEELTFIGTQVPKGHI